MLKLIAAVVLAGVLMVGFPTIPPSAELVNQIFAPCSEKEFIEVSVYSMPPNLQWVVYRDVNSKLLAILVALDMEIIRAYASIDGKVQEFASLEDLGKVVPSACELLPKKVT